MGAVTMPISTQPPQGLALLAIALMLQACAAATTAPATASQTPPANSGTVVAVRNIRVDGRDPAVDKILAALGQPASNNPETAIEVIVRRPDNTIVSIIQPTQPAQPDFVPGERVAFLNTAAAAIRPE
jgi:outer membrane lipoprotein SlyB